ncbi:MAG: hypothetical protein A2015_03495 [Spirochaetes bacterium GWF1_31_7]|nr:MAG: hypothetical protein A2Y30_07580 [Spirochaetes bacterium GWE1_32_154]OHD48444.1 MAG: hypothetical protein A2Y29_05455 [Spirochaetes bacterium GWE2_31_10]OHD50921.1 MAG: hypothetical protein A2015_03495 [Spirochaetes bacterium GWF1_31_7]OHD80509.1 MAG: hypothetical protein A2355_01595 [Spirochaetes bacterium RIFOXYB1_FULL_32_8]HBD92873.1 hypothetical protein [Spirochaetia bacterium]
MSIYRLFFLFLCMQIFIIPLFSQSIMDNFVITSLFGDSRTDHFHTGIDLFGINEPLKAKEDVITVFFNKSRRSDLKYGNGNFVLLQNFDNTFRYNYSHIEDNSYNSNVTFFNKGDIVALSGNSGKSTGYHLHLEVEDMVKKQIINPIQFFDVIDTKKPVIHDVFFVTLNNEVVSLFKTRSIVRGGKLFIKAQDFSETNNFAQVPYKISVFINGNEFYTLKFDSMDKTDNDYFISNTDKNFYNLYSTGDDYTYFIREKYFLPGLYGIKIEVSDWNGNMTVFNNSFRISGPK